MLRVISHGTDCTPLEPKLRGSSGMVFESRKRWFRRLAVPVIYIAMLTGCVCQSPNPEANQDKVSRDSIRERVLRLLDASEWTGATPSGHVSVTEQVNALIVLPKETVAEVLRGMVTATHEGEPEVSQALRNVLLFLSGVRPDASTEWQGACLLEECGVVYWGHFAEQEKSLDTYGMIPNPLSRQQPLLDSNAPGWLTVPLEPRPQDLVMKIERAEGDAVRRIEEGALAGVGVELGQLACRDRRLRDWLLDKTRQAPSSPLVRDVLAVSLAIGGVKEAMPEVRAWTREVLGYSGEWTQSRQLLRVRALRLLGGSGVVQEVRKEVESTLPNHLRLEIRGLTLDDAFIEEFVRQDDEGHQGERFAALAQALGAACAPRQAIATEALLLTLRAASHRSEGGASETAKRALQVVGEVLHPGSAGESAVFCPGLLKQCAVVESALESGLVRVVAAKQVTNRVRKSAVHARQTQLSADGAVVEASAPFQSWTPSWVTATSTRQDGRLLVSILNSGDETLWTNNIAWQLGRAVHEENYEGATGESRWVIRIGHPLDRECCRLEALAGALSRIEVGARAEFVIPIEGVPEGVPLAVEFDDGFLVDNDGSGHVLRSLVFRVQE